MIVLDTSAACEMIKETEEGKMMQMLVLSQENIASCELIRAEMLNLIRKLVAFKEIPKNEAKLHYNKAISLVDEFYSLEELEQEVLIESIRLNHPSYDLFYFVLTRRLGATLFTTDNKLIKLCQNNGVNCIDFVDI